MFFEKHVSYTFVPVMKLDFLLFASILIVLINADWNACGSLLGSREVKKSTLHFLYMPVVF